MANYNFSDTITNVVNYVDDKPSRYAPVDANIFVENILKEGFPFELFFDINNRYNNVINLSDESPIPFDSLVFTTIRGWVWGPRTPHRGKIYPRGGGYIPVELTNYFDVPKKNPS
jgi:hypothetical protein